MTNKTMACRQFLQFLVASPLFTGLGPVRLLAADTPEFSPGGSAGLADLLLEPVGSPELALDGDSVGSDQRILLIFHVNNR